MTPAILASGTDRRASLGLAAAVAVEGAALTGAGTLLVELGEGAQRRSPTLLAAPASRRIEEALRREGMRGSARGHICHLAVPDAKAGCRRPWRPRPARRRSSWSTFRGGSGYRRSSPSCRWQAAACSSPCRRSARSQPSRWINWSDAGCRCESPRDRPELSRPAGCSRERGPAAGFADAARGIARRLLGLGRSSGEPSGRQRARRGQALPALLGAGLILILAAVVLAAIGGAATGRGRVQRAADLAALSAVRSMRDDVPRLLAPGRLPDGAPNPRHLSRGEYLSRARLAAVDAARRNRVDPDRLRIAFPDAAANPPLRARATVVGEIDPERLPGGERLGDRAPIRVVASAVAEASAPVSSWTGMPSHGRGRRVLRPARLSRRRGYEAGRRRRLRPDERRGEANGARPGGGLRLPLGRRAGRALRPPSGPALGRAARPLAAPLRDRARSRPVVGVRLAARARRELRLPAAVPVGALALRLRSRSAAVLGGRQSARKRWGARGGGGPRTELRLARLRAPAVPGSDSALGGALERLARVARRSADGRVRLQPQGGVPGRRSRHRPVHAGDGPLLRAARPVRPHRVDRRPGPPDVGPPAPFPLRPSGARRLQRGLRRRRRLHLHPLSRRRAPTSRGSSPSRMGQGCCSRRRWRYGWSARALPDSASRPRSRRPP